MNNDKTIRQQLHDTALKAPSSSGVYLWKDEVGTILYVGKAKNLKNRLSSYFSGKKDIKTRLLVSKASTIEYIVTATEYEAFVLENTLIKEHRPKYNIDLKDDKSYPALRITNEDYPRIFKTRRIIQDGSQYFGPFPNSGALDTFIEYLYRRYPLRYCKKFRKRNSPCMYYHIGRCKAPCCNKIDKKSYIDSIEEICSFLNGNPQETVKKLKNEMKILADNREYEKAARIRDGITAILELHAVQTVNDYDPDARDYIGFAAEGTLVTFVVLKMRGGKLITRDLYRTHSINDNDELLEEFFTAYYDEKEKIPGKIIIPETKSLQIIQKWLYQQFNMCPEIIQINLPQKEEVLPKQNYALTTQLNEQNHKYGLTENTKEQNVATPQTTHSDDVVLPKQNYALTTQLNEQNHKYGLTENTKEQNVATPQTTHSDDVVLPKQNYVLTTQLNEQNHKYVATPQTTHSDDVVLPKQNYALTTQPIDYNQKYVATSVMAQHNAQEDIIRRVRERGDIPAMKELQKLLGLPHMPVRIEGFDIAHLHGKYPVASLISFYNGNPDKKNYRYFRLRTTDGIIDDFASMREAAGRRYTRLLNEGSELPDLILIDGGIGQVNAVQGVLSALELDIPIIGLAKRDEELYLPGNSTPISLPKRSDALRLLQRVRDETHRFATSKQQKLREKDLQ